MDWIFFVIKSYTAGVCVRVYYEKFIPETVIKSNEFESAYNMQGCILIMPTNMKPISTRPVRNCGSADIIVNDSNPNPNPNPNPSDSFQQVTIRISRSADPQF